MYFNNPKFTLEGAEKAEVMLKMLANKNRLIILCSLVEKEKSVGELQTLLSISQPLLSQHLAKMRQIGLVNTRRVGQTIFYSICSPETKAILEVLSTLYCPPEEKKS